MEPSRTPIGCLLMTPRLPHKNVAFGSLSSHTLAGLALCPHSSLPLDARTVCTIPLQQQSRLHFRETAPPPPRLLHETPLPPRNRQRPSLDRCTSHKLQQYCHSLPSFLKLLLHPPSYPHSSGQAVISAQTWPQLSFAASFKPSLLSRQQQPGSSKKAPRKPTVCSTHCHLLSFRSCPAPPSARTRRRRRSRRSPAGL